MLRSSAFSLLAISLLTLLAGVPSGSRWVPGFPADDDEEQAVRLADMPGEVHGRILIELLRELDDVQFEEATVEEEDGKAVYEIEIEMGDRDLILEIDGEGKLLKKMVESEDDEEGDDDEDDDDDGDNEDDDDDDEDDDDV